MPKFLGYERAQDGRLALRFDVPEDPSEPDYEEVILSDDEFYRAVSLAASLILDQEGP